MQKRITVNRPVAEVYAFWSDFQNLSQVVEPLATLQTHQQTTHWKAKLPANIEWVTETVETIPNELIRWQSVNGNPLKHFGSVRFSPAPGEWGTEVTLTLQFDAPDNVIGDLAKTVLDATPDVLLDKALYRFKSFVETGEIPTTKHQPAARNGGRDE